MVTSGPGVSNLATGLVTATDEGDPVLAIGGQVKRADLLKRAHQSMNNVAMLEPITKYAAEVHDANTLSETVANAYRHAKSGETRCKLYFNSSRRPMLRSVLRLLSL